MKGRDSGMILQLHAACGSNIGKIRSNNEDNFYFNGRCLALNNQGTLGSTSNKFLLTNECCFGVFDGMGGVEYGEVASFLASEILKNKMQELEKLVISPRHFLADTCTSMNLSICQKSDMLSSGRMGTTAAILMFVPDEVYVCNLGDSRVYRLRENEFMQISRDHVEVFPPDMKTKRKPRLTQYLGIYPDEMLIEPYIAKGDLQKEDIYLICSDGLTDMLTNLEIYNCLKSHISVRKAVDHLLSDALKKGGKDNITVIVVRVQ